MRVEQKHIAYKPSARCIQDTLSSRAKTFCFKIQCTSERANGILRTTGWMVPQKSAACSCMQDTFARARTRPKGYAAARPSARATIGYLVYNACSDPLLLFIHCYRYITISSRAALGLPAECVARVKVSCIQYITMHLVFKILLLARALCLHRGV